MTVKSDILVRVYVERASKIAGAAVWTAVADGERRRVLPDGCMDLIWDGRHVQVAGPDTTAFEIDTRPGAVLTGLRFAPGAAPAVLGIPAHDLRDVHVELDAVWSRPEAAQMEESVAAAKCPGGALEAAALTLGRGAPRVDPLVAELVRRARAGERVASTAAAVGLSPRQLQRRSLDAIGYGPKLLIRILRLGAALALARDGVPLAAVAASCGYADQAHLADDVRALSGTTLGGLGLGVRRSRQLAGSVAKRSIPLPSGSSTDA
jgi:AraC-like DNA-binding protein